MKLVSLLLPLRVKLFSAISNVTQLSDSIDKKSFSNVRFLEFIRLGSTLKSPPIMILQSLCVAIIADISLSISPY